MNPKVINSMNARLSRLEALLENNDVFKAAGGTTYGGLQYEGSTFNIEAPNLDQTLANNYGFGPNDMVIAELQQRINELELLVAGGSNDTNQSGAQDAGAAIGDDAEAGSGSAGEPVPSAEETAAELGLGTMAYQDASAVAITGGTAVLSSATITGGSITGITDLAVADGGTGASTASNARTNLGLGTIATQNSNNVTVTGGSISGITDLAVADGGTGASTAANARTNLGLGTMATQDSNNVSITGGAIDGTPIGATTRSTGRFTTLNTNNTITVEDAAGDDHVTIAAATNGGLITLYDASGVTRGQIYIDVSGHAIVTATAGKRLYVGDTGAVTVQGDSAGEIAFYGATPQAKATISGSRGGNAALASLLTALTTMGLINNGTSA